MTSKQIVKKRSLILLMVGMLSCIQAEIATTVPEGFVKWSIPEVTATTSFYFSIPLLGDVNGAYQAASFTSNTVTVTGAPWVSGSLSQVGTPYFVRFTTGAQQGRMILITANTTNSLTLDTTDNSPQTVPLNAVGFTLANNDLFDVVSGDTLGSILGENSISRPLILVGGVSALSADSVSIYNKYTAKNDVYYFNTSLGYWRLSSSATNQNNVIIYPGSPVAITRRGSRPAKDLIITGSVPNVAPKIKTAGSAQGVFSSTCYPVNMTLSQLGLTNWTKSNSPLSADTISIYNSLTSKQDVYYQKLDSTWRKVGDTLTDQSSVIIPAATGIGLLKRGAVSNATSYISVSIPYVP